MDVHIMQRHVIANRVNIVHFFFVPPLQRNRNKNCFAMGSRIDSPTGNTCEISAEIRDRMHTRSMYTVNMPLGERMREGSAAYLARIMRDGEK